MNINLAVEVDAWQCMRLFRSQLPELAVAARLMGVGLVVWGALNGPSVTLILLGLFAGIFPELVGLGRYWVSVKYGRPSWYVLSDRGISIRTRVTNLDIVWDAITQVRETERDWLLRGPGGAVIQLPKDAFTPPDDHAFREFIAQRQLIPRKDA
jgi:YcxB-like protein